MLADDRLSAIPRDRQEEGWKTPKPATRVSPDTELLDEATRLRLAVGRLQRRIRIDSSDSPPPLQLAVLATVTSQGRLTLSELARCEAVTVPTMSRVVNALERRGLVTRATDPADARRALITLSPNGASRLADVLGRRTALVGRRLQRLDAEGRRAIRKVLPLLESLLEDAVPPAP
ncbi:MarR family transcriptional regulator [Pseudonocardia sp. NPDC049154]|uniref:MarR family winged helix-turn-helix transcriptional regulator n=1 Tax=Pseudonocardia sp. NPDC049154 TaxID=3155501 RepID=UPI0033C2A64E